MGMVGAVVDVHVLDKATADAVFGEHALHHADEQGVHAGLEVLVERFLHQHFGSQLALAAGIAGVVEVDVVGHLFTGEDDLVGVDDDYIVAALGVGSVGGFVFSAQDFGNFRAEAAEHLVGGVDHNPFFLDALCAGRNGLVA